MAEDGTIPFVDPETGDEGVAVVRVTEDCIGLCVSLASNGDLEVFMKPDTAQSLVESLQSALTTVRRD